MIHNRFILNNKHTILLFIIILIGFLLRFSNLTTNNYWLDELYSMNFSNPQRSFADMLNLTIKDVHPPLYQSILWIWLKIFGFSESAGRLLSVIIGTITVSFSYVFVKNIYSNKTALAITLLFSVNIFLIFFSLEVRSYQLLVLLTMISYFYFYKILIDVKNKKNLYFYWLFTILMIYTHYISLFIICSQVIIILIFLVLFKEDRISFIKISSISTFIFFIALLPLLQYIITITEQSRIWFIETPNILYFISFIDLYFGKDGIYFVLIGFLFTTYHLLTSNQDKKEKIYLLVIFLWFLLAYLLPYFKSILFEPITQPRYSIIAVPAVILLSVHGITKQSLLIKVPIFVLFITFSFKNLFFDTSNTYHKHEYKKPLIYISSNKTIPIYEVVKANKNNGKDTNHFQVYSDMLKLKLVIKDETELQSDLNKNNLPKCFWVISSLYNPLLDSVDDTLDKYKLFNLQAHTLIHEKSFHGTKAYLFSKKDDVDFCQINNSRK